MKGFIEIKVMEKPLISIVLGSYNRCAFLKATVESVHTNVNNIPYELIVIDGGSTDGSLDYLKKQKDIITIIQHNRGTFRGKKITRRSWGYFMNLGFKVSRGKYILMISDDCLIVPGSIDNAINKFEDRLKRGEKIGAIAFYWRNWPIEKNYKIIQLFDKNLTMVNHGLFLTSALRDVGWINEDDYLFYCADGDLACKLWEYGYKIDYCSNAFVDHYAHANIKIRKSNFQTYKKDREAFNKRWKDKFSTGSGTEGRQFYLENSPNHTTYKQFPADVKGLLRRTSLRFNKLIIALPLLYLSASGIS